MSQCGVYIVIEGIDATGKSTQIRLIRDWLAAQYTINSVEFHEPGGAPIADEIGRIIKNATLDRDPLTNVLLFTVSRHETWRQLAVPALREGNWVVASRNWYSTQVYQGNAEGVPFEQIEETTRRFMPAEYMKPDLTIMLTIRDEAKRLQRINERGVLDHPDTFEGRDASFQKKLHEGYETIASIYQMTTVDASGTINDVHHAIQALIKPLIKERS